MVCYLVVSPEGNISLGILANFDLVLKFALSQIPSNPYSVQISGSKRDKIYKELVTMIILLPTELISH